MKIQYKKDENSNHIWLIPKENLDYFKMNTLPKLLFNKDNWIKSRIDYPNIVTGNDYWNAIYQIAQNIKSNLEIKLDMERVGCKSFVYIDLENANIKISAYNPQGYEKDMVDFVNDRH